MKNGAGIVSLKMFNGFFDKNENIPRYVHFRRVRVNIIKSLKKIGFSYKIQPNLLKQETVDEEIHEDAWEKKKNEWLPCLKNDVVSTVFCYARYTKSEEELAELGMKICLTLPSLANIFLNSLRDENVEHSYIYNDEFMRYFVQKSIKLGRCSGLNQYNKCNFSDEVFNIISTELRVKGIVCEILDMYFEYINKHRNKRRLRLTICRISRYE